MSEKKYHVKYDIDHGEFTADKLREGGYGGTDAVVVISMLREAAHQGPLSMAVASCDGTNGGEPVLPTELFLAMTALADTIMKSGSVPSWQITICDVVLAATRRCVAPPTDLCDCGEPKSKCSQEEV